MGNKRKKEKEKEFVIPVSYQAYGEFIVKARTAEEALNNALQSGIPDDIETSEGDYSIVEDVELIEITSAHRFMRDINYE